MCGIDEMQGQKGPSVWVGISSTSHKMAWNKLWVGTLCLVCFVPDLGCNKGLNRRHKECIPRVTIIERKDMALNGSSAKNMPLGSREKKVMLKIDTAKDV